MSKFTIAGLVCLCAGVAAGAQTPAPSPAPPVDVTRLGPPVGANALDVRLPDQHGAIQTLASVAGPKGTMLVFFRSADW
jgi:hypothetical protein